MQRAAQVGQRGPGNGDGDREGDQGIAGVHPGQRRGARPARSRPESRAEQRADGPGRQPCHDDPADRGQPRHQQGEDGQPGHHAHGAEPEQRGDQPADRGWGRVQGMHDGEFGGRIGAHDRYRDRDHDDGEPEPEGIGRTPAQRAAAPWAEEHPAQVAGGDRALGRQRDGRSSPAAVTGPPSAAVTGPSPFSPDRAAARGAHRPAARCRGRRTGSPGDRWRCRSPRPAGPRAGSAGSSWARTGASRP